VDSVRDTDRSLPHRRYHVLVSHRVPVGGMICR
jgi:hypothetical protein